MLNVMPGAGHVAVIVRARPTVKSFHNFLPQRRRWTAGSCQRNPSNRIQGAEVFESATGVRARRKSFSTKLEPLNRVLLAFTMQMRCNAMECRATLGTDTAAFTIRAFRFRYRPDGVNGFSVLL